MIVSDIQLELAQRLAQAASTLEFEGSLDLAQRLVHEGLLHGDQQAEMRRLLGQDKKSPLIDLLHETSGTILGRLVAGDKLSDSEKQRLVALVSGQGTIDVEGIRAAHGHIRQPFITGFLHGRGLQSVGSPHHVRQTSVRRFEPLEEILKRRVFLKLESEQWVGSFKIRGATNLILTALMAGWDPKTMRVGTASHGNHALGVVQASLNLGIQPHQIDIYLPTNSSPIKIQMLRDLGANVILTSETFEEAANIVKGRAESEANYLFVPAFDHPLVVMGQGTVGVELSRQIPDPKFEVVVPTGGGGLIAGAATYLNKLGHLIYGAESWALPYVSLSFHAGQIVHAQSIHHVDTLADGIALLEIGKKPFVNILGHVRDIVALAEEDLERGVTFLHRHGIVAEGAAGAPVAAAMYGALKFAEPGSPLVLVVTGRNIHPELLDQIIARHSQTNLQESVMTPLHRTLEAAGYYMEGKTVRTLKTVEDAKRFVDSVVENLPHGWDLLDAFERLDFGPWRSDGEKDLNASLRSFGEYKTRWKYGKKEALMHPFSSRGTAPVAFLSLLQAQRTTRAYIHDHLDYMRNILRVELECHVISCFLEKHPDWIVRLFPAGTQIDKTIAWIDDLRRTRDTIQEALSALKPIFEEMDPTG